MTPRRAETPTARTRVDRSERLRPFIARKVGELTAKVVAYSVGVAEAGLHRFLDGRTTPLSWTLDAYEQWLERGAPVVSPSDYKALDLRGERAAAAEAYRANVPRTPGERPPHRIPPERKQRADALRPLVAERVRTDGLKAVAIPCGVSESAVQEFLRGRIPLDWSLDAYEDWIRPGAARERRVDRRLLGPQGPTRHSLRSAKARRAADSEARRNARRQRADRLRPLLAERVAGLGVKQVAAGTGMSDTAILGFLAGRTPFEWTLDAYEEWLG